MIRKGDIVKRYDLPGTGTGILYEVVSIGPEKDAYVKQPGGSMHWSNRKKQKTRKVKLRAVLVMFDSKWSKERNLVTHDECHLKKVDILEIAQEWNKLQLFLQDEARRNGMAGDQNAAPKLPTEKPALTG